jgi:ATP-dependent Zn protease
MITREMERAVALVTEHRDAVAAVADALVARDVLTAEEVIDIARAHGVRTQQEPWAVMASAAA